MPLIDSHVHVWDTRLFAYAWLHGSPVNKPMLPPDLDRADGETTGTIFVQASDTDHLAEARWVSSLDWPDLVAIVAGADLLAEPAQIERDLSELASLGRVAGVRHNLQDLDIEIFPKLFRGLEALAKAGGVFDACLRHDQLSALAGVLASVSQLSVVVDHLGSPPMAAPIDSKSGQEWCDGITRMADRAETFMKLSGLTAATPDRESFDAHANDYIAHAVAAFGADRCMIGSDWPVSSTFGIGGSFGDWKDRVQSVVGTEAWPVIASQTATRVYLPGRLTYLT